MSWKISESFPEFSQALLHYKPVYVTTSGNWYYGKQIDYDTACFFGRDYCRLNKIGSVFCRYLDKLEETAVTMSLQLGEDERTRYTGCLKACQTVLEVLARNGNCSSVVRALERKVVALRYRIEDTHEGGCSALPEADHRGHSKLCNFAAEWKQQQKMYAPIDRELSERDKIKLTETAHFPLFVSLLDEDKKLRDAYFKWVIRDGGCVRQFIEYPGTWEILKKSFLTARIAYYGCEHLSIKVKNGVKQLRLPMEVETPDGLKVKKINILDPNQVVTLKHGWQLRIADICKIFGNKNDAIGDLEYFGIREAKDPSLKPHRCAVRNWNCHELGSLMPHEPKYDDIDLNQYHGLEKIKVWAGNLWPKDKYDYIDLNDPEWIKKLPVQEAISAEELRKRYDLHYVDDSGKKIPIIPDGKNIINVTRASRGSLYHELDKSHGYDELAIPQADGSYYLYDMGKFAHLFPTTLCGKFRFLTSTEIAKVSYPDENIIYHDRQQAFSAEVLTQEEGEYLLELVRRDLKRARSDDLIFQFGWENCAYWPQELMRELYAHFNKGEAPDFFKKKLLEVRVPQPLKAMFQFFKWLGRVLCEFFLRVLEWLMQAWRGIYVREDGKRVYKSLSTSPFREQRISFIPSELHKRILDLAKRIKGVVRFGCQTPVASSA